MHPSVHALQKIQQELQAIPKQFCLPATVHYTPPQVIAVSKTHPAEAILPVLEAGHLHFGENKVQEAKQKWPALKVQFPNAKVHLIGSLQTNKAAEAVALFDVIHSVDRPKLVDALMKEMKHQQRSLPCFVQVNLADEPQKGGVSIAELPALLNYCTAAGINVVGLMCIPPLVDDIASDQTAFYFTLLGQLARAHGLTQLSMGMSGDYAHAAALGATYVRVGTAIFGVRPPHQ